MARYVLSRVAIPAAAVVTEVVNLKSCKRTELPIYVPEKPKETPTKMPESTKGTPGFLEENVMIMRKTMTSVIDEMKHYEEEAMKYVNSGVDQVTWLVKYLGEEDNVAPKGPAIAIGGLTGFIFAVRGGIFKKIVYTTVGALGMASICYPEDAARYSKIALAETKQYVTIAYNFAYGVKKDDPPLELPSLPKMPGSVSEAWSMVRSFGGNADTQSSVSEKKVGDDEQNEENLEDQTLQISNVILKSHEEAVQKSCHCPIGACLHPKDENEGGVHPSSLPCPPPITDDCPTKK